VVHGDAHGWNSLQLADAMCASSTGTNWQTGPSTDDLLHEGRALVPVAPPSLEMSLLRHYHEALVDAGVSEANELVP
jgi:hypothetical protein